MKPIDNVGVCKHINVVSIYNIPDIGYGRPVGFICEHPKRNINLILFDESCKEDDFKDCPLETEV